MADEKKGRFALIDGDVLRYRIGFAAQSHEYDVKGKRFATKRLALAYAHGTTPSADINPLRHDDVEELITPDPVSHCLHSVKLQLNEMLKASQASDHLVILTGKAPTFRYDLATIRPYKGTRPDRRPVHYEAIETYLKELWQTLEVQGIEGDDALGIGMLDPRSHPDMESVPDTEQEKIICTIDKDLDMIPGWHYNFAKKLRYMVLPHEAILWFYTQLITGDSTDNIQGIPGAGPVAAGKALSPCESESDMYGTVQTMYRNAEAKGDIPEGKADAYLLENARLLWMWRTNNDEWNPPKLQGKYETEDQSEDEAVPGESSPSGRRDGGEDAGQVQGDTSAEWDDEACARPFGVDPT